MLIVQPTLELAEAFSKDRLSPMVRDCPAIRKKVSDARSRDSGNTLFQKSFSGGQMTIASANSPISLRGRPIRLVWFDEVSAMKHTAEGDPVALGIKRTNNFWNRRIVMTSTPTIKGICRIEKEFEKSDKRYFHIACPRCEQPHTLKWGNVVWPEGKPEEASFKCPACEGNYSNAEKNIAVSKCRPDKKGKKPIGIDGLPLGWRATAPFNGIAGFHIWEAYSPWRTVAEIVADFLEAKDDPSTLQVWINTCLGETWEEQGDQVSDHDLIGRCEPFPKTADIPERGLVLTAGVDTQPDRLEVETVAWAGGEESWSVDYHVIFGDPDIPEGSEGSPWNDLTDYIRKSWKHEGGGNLTIETTCIDSGGHNTQAVYRYAKAHRGERVFAIKGQGGSGIPIVGNPSRRRSGKKTQRPVDVYIVGVDQAKSIIYKRLRITAAGPGCCHFPIGRSTEYFRQITSEKMMTRYFKGFPKREWVKESGRRNEALDCRVYAFAALILRAPQFDKIAFRIKQRAKAILPNSPVDENDPEEEKTAHDQEEAQEDSSPKPLRRRRRRNSYLNSWRD